jgi:endonuclease/exonuclease/phosphatase family metal-dependent hydrolase
MSADASSSSSTQWDQSGLRIHPPSKTYRFTLLQYNIDMAVREEKHEETKWANRGARVAKLIRAVDADIVCLQELRDLPGQPPILQWLAQFSDVYGIEVSYRNASSLAFGQAILYKRTKFFAQEKICKWLTDDGLDCVPASNYSTNPKDAGSMIMDVRLIPVVEGRAVVAGWTPFSELRVINLHFGMDEDAKTKSCQYIDRRYGTQTNSTPMVLAGDLNLFPDKNADKQRAILTTLLQDAGKGAIADHNAQPLEGTFIGYEHDEFKADFNNMNSRLDHVLTSRHAIVHRRELIVKTMLEPEPEPFSKRNAYPSDHLPLLVDIEMPY